MDITCKILMEQGYVLVRKKIVSNLYGLNLLASIMF